jgi:mRNA interferase RelE/StbE
MSEPRYYSVKLTPKAERDMKKIPSEFQRALCEELISLSGERHPKKWTHRIIRQRGLYSVRVGDYRAVVTLQDNIMIILVVEAGNRS